MTPQEIAIAALEEAGHEDDPVDIAVTYKIALEQIARGGWVPVSERLPEDGADVLITTKSCKKIVHDAIWDKSTKRFFLFGQDSKGHTVKLICNEITAWMPLPEAYKEATDETD